MGKIVRHQDLEVYKKAFAAAMRIFELSKSFPKEETFSLTDQMRRASRSVCANLAEAWRNVVMKPPLSQKYATRKANQPKLRLGWSLPCGVNISKRKPAESCLRNMTKSLPCSFQ
jgi:23S rRNA-intervening sequence protein